MTKKMKIPKTEIEFRNAMIDAAQIGAQKALELAGLTSPTIRLSEAYRQYGRGQVDRWIREKVINPIKDGDRNTAVRINRTEIATAAQMANREQYFSNI